jgi:hypothetical protein
MTGVRAGWSHLPDLNLANRFDVRRALAVRRKPKRCFILTSMYALPSA